MKSFCFLLIPLLLFTVSCGDPAPVTNSTTSSLTNDVPVDSSSNSPLEQSNNSLPDKHSCVPKGIILDNNQIWIRAHQLLVCIVADSVTYDMDFGPSHRILDVYDTKKCELVNRNILPVNNSPDYPYYLSTETYEDKNKVICMQGFEYTFCYDLVIRKLLPQLKPQYLSRREAMDAQSGSPMGLKIWDQYLLGYAQDFGAFAFDLKNKTSVNNVIPVAEYPVPDQPNRYQSLFLFKMKAGEYQAVIPSMDETLSLKTLFKEPISLDPTLSKNARNNRYLIFNVSDTNPARRIAIDMKRTERVNLPNGISVRKSSEILDWLKTRK